MNYKKIYNNIVDNRKRNPLDESEYGEWHHIIPDSLGGTNDPENLIRLSAREHFICHALLADIYEEGSNEWHKMNHAFMMMKSNSENQNRYYNSRLYEYKRKDFSKVMSKLQSGSSNSQHGKLWIYHMIKEKSIIINKSELDGYESNGWKRGRILNFKKKKENIKWKEEKLIRKHKKMEEYKKKRIKEATELFDLFVDSEYESIREFCRESNVNYSQGSLSGIWKRWIPHLYNPKPRTNFKNRV